MTAVRYFEALQIWDWVQWRLSIDLWLEAQQYLRGSAAPTPTDPQLAQGLALLLNPGTPRSTKLSLIKQLLDIIKSLS